MFILINRHTHTLNYKYQIAVLPMLTHAYHTNLFLHICTYLFASTQFQLFIFLQFFSNFSGSNLCAAGSTSPNCCTTRFHAVPGRDPTSGWGERMLLYFNGWFIAWCQYVILFDFVCAYMCINVLSICKHLHLYMYGWMYLYVLLHVYFKSR